MNPKLMALAFGCALSATAAAQHAGHGAVEAAPDEAVWTSQPVLLPAARGGRGGVVLRPRGIEVGQVTVFGPDAAAGPGIDQPIVAGEARIAPAGPGKGNYHWVTAREESGEVVRVASTAWYFSAPGNAPTALLAVSREALEIVPAPLPREHGHYREGEPWRFAVRWRGAPLPGQRVALETENGTTSVVETGADGMATVVFPRDFPADAATDARRARAAFVLATEHAADGRRHVTAFNYDYAPDPGRSHSLAWGAGFGLLGMLLATPMLRRKEPKNG